MHKVYLATVVAIFVTTSLATNLLVVGIRGPAASGSAVRSRFRSRRFSRWMKYHVDAWVAAMLASRERQAAIYARTYLTDRQFAELGFGRRPGSASGPTRTPAGRAELPFHAADGRSR